MGESEIQAERIFFQNEAGSEEVNDHFKLELCRHCHVLCENPEACPCHCRTIPWHSEDGRKSQKNCFQSNFFFQSIILQFTPLLLFSLSILISLCIITIPTHENILSSPRYSQQSNVVRLCNLSVTTSRPRFLFPMVRIRPYNRQINPENDAFQVFQLTPEQCSEAVHTEVVFKKEFRDIHGSNGETAFGVNLLSGGKLSVWIHVLMGSLTVLVRKDGEIFRTSVIHHDGYNQFEFQAPYNGTYELAFQYDTYTVAEAEIVRREYERWYILSDGFKPFCDYWTSINPGCLVPNEKGSYGCTLVKAKDGRVVRIRLETVRSWPWIWVISFLPLVLGTVWLKVSKHIVPTLVTNATPTEIYAFLESSGSANNHHHGVTAMSYCYTEQTSLLMESHLSGYGSSSRSSGTSLENSSSYHSFTIVLPSDRIHVES